MRGCTETALGVAGLWDRLKGVGLGLGLGGSFWGAGWEVAGYGCRLRSIGQFGESRFGVQIWGCRIVGASLGVDLGVQVLACRIEDRRFEVANWWGAI